MVSQPVLSQACNALGQNWLFFCHCSVLLLECFRPWRFWFSSLLHVLFLAISSNPINIFSVPINLKFTFTFPHLSWTLHLIHTSLPAWPLHEDVWCSSQTDWAQFWTCQLPPQSCSTHTQSSSSELMTASPLFNPKTSKSCLTPLFPQISPPILQRILSL